jgi:hypothetical protein
LYPPIRSLKEFKLKLLFAATNTTMYSNNNNNNYCNDNNCCYYNSNNNNEPPSLNLYYLALEPMPTSTHPLHRPRLPQRQDDEVDHQERQLLNLPSWLLKSTPLLQQSPADDHLETQ